MKEQEEWFSGGPKTGEKTENITVLYKVLQETDVLKARDSPKVSNARKDEENDCCCRVFA